VLADVEALVDALELVEVVDFVVVDFVDVEVVDFEVVVFVEVDVVDLDVVLLVVVVCPAAYVAAVNAKTEITARVNIRSACFVFIISPFV
jgi:hypothetical protein